MKRWFIVFGLCSTVFVSAFTYASYTIEKEEAGERFDEAIDTVIVLGAHIRPDATPSLSLQYRLDRTLELYERYDIQTIIVTGGRGANEPIPESEAMASYLIERGVPEERIVLESRSTSTYENIHFAKAFTDRQRVAIVSSHFHLKRARYLAEKEGLEPTMIAAPTPPTVKTRAHVRECVALLKTWVIGK